MYHVFIPNSADEAMHQEILLINDPQNEKKNIVEQILKLR